MPARGGLYPPFLAFEPVVLNLAQLPQLLVSKNLSQSLLIAAKLRLYPGPVVFHQRLHFLMVLTAQGHQLFFLSIVQIQPL